MYQVMIYSKHLFLANESSQSSLRKNLNVFEDMFEALKSEN